MSRHVAIAVSIILAFCLALPARAQVNISCGTDSTIQTAINANPSGTTFNLAASCTYNFGGAVAPKSNDQFIGAGVGSTIIDGGLGEHFGWTSNGSYPSGSGAATGVVIANMTVQNFGSATAANADFAGRAFFTADGWIIRDSKIINNVTGISEVGNGVTIVNNQINNNRGYGIISNLGPFPSSNSPVVVKGNEIGGNNTLLWDTCNGSVIKFTDIPASTGNSLQFLNNYVHDNNGPGYWYDTGVNTTSLVQGNTFVKNGSGGIINEVTTGATNIQKNVFIDNGNSSTQSGSTCGRWFPYPDIWVHGAPSTTVQQNNFSNEIGPSSPGGSYGGLPLGISDDDCRGSGLNVGNNSFHDNTITFKSPASGSGINSQSGTWGTWYACSTAYAHVGTSSNSNHFHVPGGSTSDVHFAWFPNWTTPISFAAFQTAGQEAAGSIDTTNASVAGCTGPWPGASGVGICPNGSGWPLIVATSDFTLTVTPAPTGGGACTGGNSGFVPAGYTCSTSLSDEFNGSSLDTTKWKVGVGGGRGSNVQDCSSQPGFVTVSGGIVTMKQQNNSDGTTVCSSGMQGILGTWPPAPAYMEIRAQFNVNATGGIWTFGHNVPNGSVLFEVDGFGAGIQAASGHGLFPFGFSWGIPGFTGGGSIGGSFSGPVIDIGSGSTTSFHIYGYLRAGDGTIKWLEDGVLIGQHTGLGGSGWETQAGELLMSPHPEFGSSLLNPSPDFMYIDYVRVYCPGCN